MAFVLVVDDEEDIAKLIAFNLNRKGHDTQIAYSGEQALDVAFKKKPDIIVLDRMMPGMNGIQVLKELRRDTRTKNVPIIFLTARAQTEDRIEGLELGADDYVTKPFSPRELALRIDSVLKRSVGIPGDVELECGPFRMDMNHLKLYIDGEPVDVTVTEFKLLFYLIERKNQVLDRNDLLRCIWGYSESVQSRTLDTHMKRIRSKLGKYSDMITTVRSVGYCFSLPDC